MLAAQFDGWRQLVLKNKLQQLFFFFFEEADGMVGKLMHYGSTAGAGVL